MTCDCEFFNFGDPVRNRQNPHLTGVVIGDRNWGSEYQVRLADGASTIWWHGFEIEHDPDGERPAKEDDDTNVVKVDFTQRRAMTAETTTEGAA
ncbi:hypothetical protein [Agrobacterium tumefaciens]|uniref:hypothetical protein n=1 Tax=Agrobacterium tumefaciens TaxID=358 RepID=UPI0015735B00|nr:hypothetical protein [Agrobacterium tumefaciens]